jgi:hypothetical protein
MIFTWQDMKTLSHNQLKVSNIINKNNNNGTL